MGIFSGKGKKESISLSDAEDVLGNPRALRGMSKKQVDELKRKIDGKPKVTGDIRAGLSDLKKGRKGGGVGPPPEVRKGRSMWS